MSLLRIQLKRERQTRQSASSEQVMQRPEVYVHSDLILLIQQNKNNNIKKIRRSAFGRSWRNWDKGLARTASIAEHYIGTTKAQPTAREAEAGFFNEFSSACITSHSVHGVLCAFTQLYSQPIRGYHLSPDLCWYCPCIYLTLSVDYALSACLWKLTEAKNYTLRAGGKRIGLICFYLGFGMAQKVSENQPVETKPAITFTTPQRSHLPV